MWIRKDELTFSCAYQTETLTNNAVLKTAHSHVTWCCQRWNGRECANTAPSECKCGANSQHHGCTAVLQSGLQWRASQSISGVPHTIQLIPLCWFSWRPSRPMWGDAIEFRQCLDLTLELQHLEALTGLVGWDSLKLQSKYPLDKKLSKLFIYELEHFLRQVTEESSCKLDL